MERLQERLIQAEKALAALQLALAKSGLDELERDGLVLRFAMAAETVWKLAQRHLAEREALDVGSPKACARASFESGLLDESQCEAALMAMDDRNMVVHVYNEALAAEILARIPAHASVLRAWFAAIQRRASSP